MDKIKSAALAVWDCFCIGCGIALALILWCPWCAFIAIVGLLIFAVVK